MEYAQEDYEKDLHGEIKHTESKEHFEAFYEMLGNQEVQKGQRFEDNRMSYLKPKGEIIELGCHIGFNVIYYARQGFNVTGVDISESLLEEAFKKASEEPKEVLDRITFIRSWIEDLDTIKKFDVAILTETLEHVIDPLIVLKKARELLKPDGILYISVPESKVGTNSHIRGINKTNMERLLEESGLEPKEWHSSKVDIILTAKIK